MDMRTPITGLLRGVAYATFAAVLLALPGCAGARVPAIDPTGERLILPNPYRTQVVSPFEHGCCLFGAKPAFATPTTPPPCDFPYVEPADPCDPCSGAMLGSPVPCAPGCPPAVVAAPPPAPPGLTISPSRLVSPIGSEVVLMAGAGGPPGLCHAKNRIEWMLSQDSVGNFVQIGEDDCDVLDFFHRVQPEKKSADYAIGFVSRRGTRVTRGTPQPQDDVAIPAGFSWLTLTSPTEGTSHVTAYAPDAKGWDTRQQSATIYWIDAQWAFPPPAIARAGERQVLTTSVSRQSNSSPLVGWIVRYEIIGGPTAQFLPGNTQSIEVPVNANGQASAEIVPQGREGGVTQIAIQIIRPAGADGLPRLPVGQGETSVSWSAPGLGVRIVGPPTAASNSTVNYRIEVYNPGDIAARDVEVVDDLPAGLTLTASTPQPSAIGNKYTWKIGELAPRSAQAIDLTCTASGRGDIRHCVTARTADGLTAENCAVTRISMKSLNVDMKGPVTANVGDTIQYQVTIANQGTAPIRDIQLVDRYDAGFRNNEAASPIQRQIPEIPPGQSVQFALTFQVIAPGKICHSLQISAPAEETIIADGCLQAGIRAAPPDLRVSHVGPQAKRIGEVAEFTIDITNAGSSPITNLRIVDTTSASLQQKAAEGADLLQNVNPVTWVVINLAPGQSIRKRFVATCLQVDPKACNRITYSSDQTAPIVKDACLEIAPQQAGPAPAPIGVNPIPPVGPGPMAEPAVTGQLKVTATETGDTIRVGRVFSYYVDVTNERNVADKNVAVTLFLPDGVTYSKLFSNAPALGILRASPDGRSIDLTPVAEMRPGDKVTFRIDVTATKAGNYNFQAKVVSQRQPTAITVKEDTTIFAE